MKTILPVLLIVVIALLAIALRGKRPEERIAIDEPRSVEIEAGESAADRDAPVTPEQEAPPAAKDPIVRHFVDREAKSRIPHDITSRVFRIDESDLPAVVGVLNDISDSDTVRNEAANMLRRTRYANLTDDLIAILQRPNESERFRAFCIHHLSTNHAKSGNEDERNKIVDFLRFALEDRHTAVRREALRALVETGDPAGVETALALLKDPDAVGVQDVAIRCLRELDLREHIQLVRDFIGHPEEAVRIAVVVTLSEWNDEESRPAFLSLLDNGSPRERNAAALALRRLDQ